MKAKELLIDAEPVKKFIVDGLNNPDKKKAFGYDAIEILAEIEYAPTVDAVEVVHGQWEQQQGLYSCSECGKTCPYDVQADTIMYWTCNYCPSCGAKMDGGNEDV